MSLTDQSNTAVDGDSFESGRIDAREFLASCALCSLGGLAVLAGLAQTLVWLWGPAV